MTFHAPAVSVALAADALGCKRTKVFELLRDGVLERAPRYGREIRIYTASIARALAPRSGRHGRAPHVPSAVGFDVDDVL